MLRTWGICFILWIASWFFPEAVASHWLTAAIYGALFVLALAFLLKRIPRLIRSMFPMDENELISCLRRDRGIRREIELSEANIPYLILQPLDKQIEGFAVLVKETSRDVQARARGTHFSRITEAMSLVFIHLGLVALTFASADLVVQISTVNPNEIVGLRHDMPASLLERLLLYFTVRLDHMSLGNLRSSALPWQAEFLLVAEVLAGLWIVAVLIPLVFNEASVFRALLEDRNRVEIELERYWSVKYGISI